MKKLRFSLLSLAVAAALLLPALPARAEGLELTAPSAAAARPACPGRGPGAHRTFRRADGGLHRPGAL